jgi:hypothetical protein
MTTPALTVVELTDDELRLVRNALHSFRTLFGHEEADVAHAIEHVLAKLPAATAPPA